MNGSAHILWKSLVDLATPENNSVWSLICNVLGSIASAIVIGQWIAKWKIWKTLRKQIGMVSKRIGNFWNHLAFDLFNVSRFPASSLAYILNPKPMATKKKPVTKSAKKKAPVKKQRETRRCTTSAIKRVLQNRGTFWKWFARGRKQIREQILKN